MADIRTAARPAEAAQATTTAQPSAELPGEPIPAPVLERLSHFYAYRSSAYITLRCKECKPHQFMEKFRHEDLDVMVAKASRHAREHHQTTAAGAGQ